MNEPATDNGQVESLRREWRLLRTQVNNHPFLRGMTPAQLATLTDCAMRVEFGAGQVIFKEGEEADRFVLISEGEVALEAAGPKGAPVLVQTIGAGEVIGWSWMFPPYRWHFTARAVQPTTGVFFHATSLREQCDRDPALGYKLMNRIAQVVIERLQNTRRALLEAWAAPAMGASAPFHHDRIDPAIRGVGGVECSSALEAQSNGGGASWLIRTGDKELSPTPITINC